MNEFLGRLEEWITLFYDAMHCLFQTLTGQETTCPPCWKCTAIRWTVFVAMCAGLHYIFGFLFDLIAIVCLILLFFYGAGPWQKIREYFWPPAPPSGE